MLNNHFYIGVHQTSNLEDGYMGSGTILKKAYQKYGIEHFRKEIIQFFDNEHDMYEAEANAVNDILVKSNECYNVNHGGHGGWTYCHLHVTKEQVRKAQETRNSRNYPSPMLGKHHSEEAKQKMRIAKLGKKATDEARQHMSLSRRGKKRKPHSEETKKKLSVLAKLSHTGVKKEKVLWLTPNGELKSMDKRNARVHHPDWTLVK